MAWLEMPEGREWMESPDWLVWLNLPDDYAGWVWLSSLYGHIVDDVRTAICNKDKNNCMLTSSNFLYQNSANEV
ncbi:hypothetical protein AGMMS49921_02040 [Endomicrobiia bacterium]|nr:hypothetical protein AGMMS49921_02040 [Endomicrobiia bacterium]